MSEKIRSATNSNRSYPDKIENEKFCLVRKKSGTNLIYEVQLKDGRRSIMLGTCKVLDRWTENGHDIIVEELKAQSSLMRKKLKEISKVIRANIV